MSARARLSFPSTHSSPSTFQTRPHLKQHISQAFNSVISSILTMEEEQEGVDFFTFDLLRRTRARTNRLKGLKAEDPDVDTPSVRSSSPIKSIASSSSTISGRGSPLKAVNSNGSLLSNIPFADESVCPKKSDSGIKSNSSIISNAQENPGPVSSVLKVEEDLPRYKVEIKSRFSPTKTKKPSAPVYRPSPNTLAKPSEIKVSSIALPMPPKATVSKVEPKPCRLPSVSKLDNKPEPVKTEESKEDEKKTIEIPGSAPIADRIKNLQKLFGTQNSVPESPAPEKLPVFAKKRLFERKIKEETNQAQESIKRNEYLAQKRGISSTDISLVSASTSGDFTHPNPRPSIAGIGKGLVKKMQEKLVSPESNLPRTRSTNRVTFTLPEEQSTSTASALNKFSEIQDLSSEHNEYSPEPNHNVYFGARPCQTNDFTSTDDDMELDSQSSQETSPKKISFYVEDEENLSQASSASNRSNRMYPDLASVEESEHASYSPSKRSRFESEEELRNYRGDDDEEYEEEEEYEELKRTPSKRSLPLHEAIEQAVNDKFDKPSTPMRTLSQYRLEQKKKAQVDASVVPKVVYGTIKRDHVQEALAEQERQQKIQRKIVQLQNEEVPKYETMIEQTSNLLNSLKPSDCGTEAHADTERHLKLLSLKRIAAMNEIHRLRSIQKEKPVAADFVTGSIDFERIDVPINHELRLACNHGLVTKNSLNAYYFVAVSYSGIVHASDCQTLRDGISSQFLSFKLPHGLKITGVRHDFQLRVEIFGWSVAEEKHGKHGFGLKLTPKKKSKSNPSPAGPMVIRKPQFELKGAITLTHKNLLKKNHSLTDFHDKSLDGTLQLQVKLDPEYKQTYANYLHFYEDYEGSWRRRWVKLDGHIMKYWIAPDAEERGEEPLKIIDLKLCINPSLERLTSDICPRKNSFALVLASCPEKTAVRVNYLLNKNYSSVVRMFVAADVSEDCDEWIYQLSSLIRGMRLWDSQVLKACSTTDFEKYIRME